MDEALLSDALDSIKAVEAHLDALISMLEMAHHDDLLKDAHYVAAGAVKIRMALHASAHVLAEAEMKEHREAAGMEVDPLVPLDETPDVPSDEIA